MLSISIIVPLMLAFLGLFIYIMLVKMQKWSIGIKVFGIIMLFYSLWLSSNFYFTRHPVEFYKIPLILRLLCAHSLLMNKYSFLTLLIILIYLISSINILKLKNWARVLSVISSGILVSVMSLFILILFMSKSGFLGPEYKENFAWVLMPIYDSIKHFFPAFLFLFFFIHPKVKERFK